MLVVEHLIYTKLLDKNLPLIKEELKSLDTNLTEEDINFILSQDPDFIFEFLGTIAGLGGKMFSRLGNRMSAYSAKRQQVNQVSGARKAHHKAIQAYGKSLKGGDLNARNQALIAMRQAQQAHWSARGKKGTIGSFKKAGTKFHSVPRNPNIYKRMTEALIKESTLGYKKKLRIQRKYGTNGTTNSNIKLDKIHKKDRLVNSKRRSRDPEFDAWKYKK